MLKKEIKVKTDMSLNKLGKYLDDLATCMRMGTICVVKGDDFVALKPADKVALEMEAESKKGKESLTISISWEVEKNSQDSSVDLLNISSLEPARV